MKILPEFNIFNRLKQPKKMVRPTFKTVTEDGCVVHSDISVKYKDGDATLSTTCQTSGSFDSHSIYTQIKNKDGQLMGDYSYSIDPADRNIDYGYIKTKTDFRHKGIAEIMRLSSLMELKENCLSALKIDALPEAVVFHSKYKFQPDLKGKNTTLSILDNIVNKTNADETDKKGANKLIKKIVNDGGDVLTLSPARAKEVNNYVSHYIKKNKNNWENANFKHNLPMVLTDKQVSAFSKFFNKLFKKHGIDYTV